MNKKLLLISLLAMPAALYAQSALDAYQISQRDLKGTARFMSMGGAFGALGGDLSTFSQNPAGVGVYRRSEIGFTLDLDCQSVKSEAQGLSTTTNSTKFLLNNIGGVATYRLNSTAVPNLNFGFAYNRGASFNRRYSGTIRQLQNSVSNFMAGVTNGSGVWPADDLSTVNTNQYDYYQGSGAPWISILGYNSYMITPEGTEDAPHYVGQWGNGTSGSGYFDIEEKGGIDEYNIAIGGNIADVVYWGMNFGIIDLNYTANTLWGESLNNVFVDGTTAQQANTDLYNYYNVNGTGFNYKIGFIVKPIQELRLGFAVSTPTWYTLDESFQGTVNYSYPGTNIRDGYATTNDNMVGTNSYNFRTPWNFTVSAAAVIGSSLIISADYQWTPYQNMHYSEANGYFWNGGGDYWDDDWDWWYAPAAQGQTRASNNDPFYDTNNDIKEYYQASSMLRVGAEVRVTPQFSIRAGYAFQTSPVKQSVRDNQQTVYTVGTTPQYSLDNTINYITCGLGYKYQKFYVDAAYVYKRRSSTYHAYTPDPGSSIASPQANITDSNSQVVLSMGFRF